MSSREMVVRIIQPAEKPEPPKKGVAAIPPEKKEKSWFQMLLNGVGMAVIAAIGIYFVVSFFNFGFTLRDILIIVGVPLAVGIVTSYAIL